MNRGLELRLALPTTLLISLLLVVSIVADTMLQKRQTETELSEQAYILSQEMQSVWDFISVNQELINTDGDGSFTFKGLHCSIVGASVGALFTNRTDYVIRYVSDHPRNPNNSPDSFEMEAIGVFRDNPTYAEYADFGTLESGESYYRYAVPLRMKTECADCHGEPAGEIDITGYEREGLQKNDLVGIASISIPTALYDVNLLERIIQRGLLSFVVLAICLLTIIFVTKRYVIRPIGKIADAVNKVSAGDFEARVDPDAANAKDEFRALSIHFNDMASELNALHNNLEDLVRVRTDQLAGANEMLLEQARELEEMNERLQTDDLNKSHFFTMMSHELRTPITAIRAYVDILRDSSELDSDARDAAVSAIQSNARSLSKLVDNILDSARLEAGALKLERTVVDVADIRLQLQKTLSPLAQDKGIELNILPCEDVEFFFSDPNRIIHVLENLGSNAIKYTNRGGHVTVKTFLRVENNTINFEVSDDGIGISREDQLIIFDKFTQTRESTIRPTSGSGLGLALAREYATLLEGGIEVVSEPGRGSTFTFYVPYEDIDFEYE